MIEENFPIPLWRGEPLEGKTILLYSELGFGDEILLLRFAKPVKDMGARVIVSVRQPVARLARSLPFADAIVIQYGPAPYEQVEILECDLPPWQPDYICALLAVPMYVRAGLACIWPADERFPLPAGMDPNTLPGRAGYIEAEDRGFRLPDGFNVGICWVSGGSHQGFAARKSLAVAQLAPLARSGVNLVSLQKDAGDDLGSLGVIDVMSAVSDFADTAAVIGQLDLVVTVDTAVAHLAGALGKPVWNLVRLDTTSMWPWFWDTELTCWYDSMILYRQSREGDWDEPLSRLFADFDRVSVPIVDPHEKQVL